MNAATYLGIGFIGAMVLLFLGLKLGGAIDWDWIWVFAPIWGPLAFAATVFAVVWVAIWRGL